MKIKMHVYIALISIVTFSCKEGEQLFDEQKEVRIFWENFITSYESGDTGEILNLIQEPHSELIRSYARAESAKVRFINELNKRFDSKGLKYFNRHDVVGGPVLIWPSLFRSYSPTIIDSSPNSITIDDGFGWILVLKPDKDKVFRISNWDQAFSSHNLKQSKLEYKAYEYGLILLKSDVQEIKDIPEIRSKIFEILELQ